MAGVRAKCWSAIVTKLKSSMGEHWWTIPTLSILIFAPFTFIQKGNSSYFMFVMVECNDSEIFMGCNYSFYVD